MKKFKPKESKLYDQEAGNLTLFETQNTIMVKIP